MDPWCNARRIAFLRRYCRNFLDRGVDMTTFCNECGRYQGHEKTCSQSEQVTIDDLSHENTLVRARNERLEAEKVELLREIERISVWASVIVKHAETITSTGSAT
jgi:hypothetical protein